MEEALISFRDFKFGIKLKERAPIVESVKAILKMTLHKFYF